VEALMVVEVLSGYHRVRARHRFSADGGIASCTVGRGATCDVVLDDPFVAPVHARITTDADGYVTVADLESLNGIEVGGRRVHGGEPVHVTDGVFRIGHTRVRVRTARETVPPERTDRSTSSWLPQGAETSVLAAGFTVGVLATVFEVWTGTTQPRELSTALVATLVILLAAAGLWIALWALASRVAFGESRWLRHAAIVAVVYAALSVVTRLVDVINGALGLHVPAAVSPILIGLAVSVALSAHLMSASPMRTWLAVAIGVTAPAVIIAVMLWTQTRNQNRSPNHVADRDEALPPILLISRGLSLDAFTNDLTTLRARADANRAFVEREDPSPEDDSDSD
jgi:hypothetical protein